ncbi:Uncharacterized protein ACO02O_01518 [Dirofilaria immitis]
MGPLESKHDKHKRYLDATPEREKKSFFSRLRKNIFQKYADSRKYDRKCLSASKHASEKSHLMLHLPEDYQIDHQRQNNEEQRSKRQANAEERKKFAKISRKKKNGLRNSLKKIESNKTVRKSSEAYSANSIHKMSSIQMQKNRSNQKEKSFGKMLQSWHRIPEWSSSSSSTREKIKAFFSRPMQDASVRKFVEKIKKRNELRKENIFKEKVLEAPLRRADEKFPSRRQIERLKPQMRTKNDRIILLKKSISRVTNKDNEGELFDEDGIPFWSKSSKVQKDSERKSEEITDEDLPMDSELLLEVQAGLRELVKMPKIRIVMDPYAPLDYLKSRDEIFFTNEVIFSNTVRSMVNLYDEISNKEIISKRNRRLGKIFIEEPIKVTQYNEDNPLMYKQIPI